MTLSHAARRQSHAASRQRQGAPAPATRADRVPSQAAVLGALQARDMLPAIWFIFSRAGCDRAAAAAARGGPLLVTAEERALIAVEIDALRCAARRCFWAKDDDRVWRGVSDWMSRVFYSIVRSKSTYLV